MAFNSPGVRTEEKDLTFNIQSITSNASGYVGMFRWGPVNQVVDINTNEAELVRRFGRPDTATTGFFHAAANYLLYSVPLSIVRVVGESALNSVPEGEDPILVRNEDEYEVSDLQGISFIGKYPGDLGNSILIAGANHKGFAEWEYRDNFEFAPSEGQINVVIIDAKGEFTGIRGAVLETYELMTNVPGSKKSDGTPAYLREVIKTQSQYVWVGDSDEVFNLFSDDVGEFEIQLQGGSDDNNPEGADFISAWDLFSSKESVDVIRTFTSFNPDAAVIRAIDVAEARQDVVVFHAPPLSTVYNNPNRVEGLLTYFGEVINKPSSYTFKVDNWKLVYDKYNDRNIWIPCDSDAAGLHARVFALNEAHDSPAGFNRGHLKNVVRLAWNSEESERDILYKNGINSIVAFKGEGTVLFGDKTGLMSPSKLSRIGVRSLFIVMKKSISRAARYQLFELNDFYTQSIFRNATIRYLEDIQGRRGIIDKMVVCDESNNTPQVIDNNEFVGDIYVKPNNSINFIRLSFVAVATGVDFQEIEGA